MPDITGIGAVANLATNLLDKIFPDKIGQEKERAEYMLKAQELDTQLAQAQLAVNQAEAQSSDAFTSRARPFIMWVCGVAFAYKFVMQPFLIFALVALGSSFDYHRLPVLDWTEMSPVLLMMLGGTTARTFEKIKGVSK